MRILLVVLALAAVALVLLWPRRAAPPSPPPAEVTEGESKPPAAAAASDPERERARKKLLEVKAALEKVPAMPAGALVVEAPLSPRPGESPAFFEERKRAVAEFHHLVQDAHLSPDAEQALMRILADAQENWRLALESVGRKQPEAPGAEMADPVLQQLFLPINEEVMRSARALLDPPRAAVLQSYLPTSLSYLRTRPFESAR
jgi:hypothetical protein